MSDETMNATKQLAIKTTNSLAKHLVKTAAKQYGLEYVYQKPDDPVRLTELRDELADFLRHVYGNYLGVHMARQMYGLDHFEKHHLDEAGLALININLPGFTDWPSLRIPAETVKVLEKLIENKPSGNIALDIAAWLLEIVLGAVKEDDGSIVIKFPTVYKPNIFKKDKVKVLIAAYKKANPPPK